MGSYGRNGERRRQAPVETLTTGLILTAVFGGLAVVFHEGWLIFPLVFAGVLPAIRGLRRLVAARVAAREAAKALSAPPPPEAKASAEKEILRVAQESGGIVTPALVALRSTLTIDLAEEVLQDLARRGHAAMTVGDDGRVEYRFPEFGPRLEAP